MKKILTSVFVLAMVACLCVNVFAAGNGFVISPSGNSAPGVITFTPGNENCEATIIITPYNERETLPEDECDEFEQAYDDVASSDDLTKLNEDLGKASADKNVKAEDIAVSDLFKISSTDCENHDKHNPFEITLKAETLNNFVGLIYKGDDGEWKYVKDATVTVTDRGVILKFSADTTDAVFAVVVDGSAYENGGTTDNGGAGADKPQTGDDTNVYPYAVVMAVSVIGLIVISVLKKKEQNA